MDARRSPSPPCPGRPSSANRGALALAASLDLLEASARMAAALAARRPRAAPGRPGPHLDLGRRRQAGGERRRVGLRPGDLDRDPDLRPRAGREGPRRERRCSRQHAARHEQLHVEVALGRAPLRGPRDALAATRAVATCARPTSRCARARRATRAQSFNAMQIGAFDVLDAKEARGGRAPRARGDAAARRGSRASTCAELLAGSLDRERLDAFDLPEAAERPTPPKGH